MVIFGDKSGSTVPIYVGECFIWIKKHYPSIYQLNSMYVIVCRPEVSQPQENFPSQCSFTSFTLRSLHHSAPSPAKLREVFIIVVLY